MDSSSRQTAALPIELENARNALVRLLKQCEIDRAYIASPDADPGDVNYYRCQLEIEEAEIAFLRRKIEILERWLSDRC